MHVYLIESSNVFAPVLVQLIDRTSARVVGRTTDARTAIREIPTLKPDVVIVGIPLATRNGFDVLNQIGAMRPRPIAIVLADDASERARERALRSGAAYYFDKFHDLHAWTDVLRDLSLLIQQRRLESGDGRAPIVAAPSALVLPDQGQARAGQNGDTA
jgi:DNA-binding NarL/FixJ family response regulator